MVYHGGPEDDDETLAAGEDEGAALDEDDELEPDTETTLESEPPDRAHGESRRKRLERILPEILKRAIEKGLETGIGTLTNSREALQGVVGKVELPKEVASYVLSQVDETKNAMVRVVAREVREFLEAADLAKELQRALTSLSFEIRTEIRFIPNDAGGVTPDVKARVGPTTKQRGRRRGLRRPSAEAQEPEDGSDV
ncbi:hypothetical protein [Sandaracinus amylolyticus]|uniref:hypothetical protein n=1 Tax=Sandaracinus amylolyticus TaxID=927083 RepID=UPI001F22A42B|nr:hypothetical protein [Sandaracinus amylolyticus]UJR80546.1 Hypothetical protein I5071_25930 [Sandaracinus amylolyticus]